MEEFNVFRGLSRQEPLQSILVKRLIEKHNILDVKLPLMKMSETLEISEDIDDL